MEVSRNSIFRSRRNFITNLRSQPEIIKAIVRNNAQWVQNIMDRSSANDWNVYDQNRRTPLHLAASLGYHEISQLLISSEYFTVNSRDNDLITPLHRACRNDHVETVKLLLQHKAEVNARSKQQTTPLHICAMFGSLECARLIIDQVSNIDFTDQSGATALHYAVYNSKVEMVEFLLEKGAKVDVQDKFGQRPIHYAAIVNNSDILITLVQKGGADINVRNKDLLTPLLLSVAYKAFDVFLELIQKLGANIDAQDMHGNNSVHWAAYIGCLPIFEFFSQMKLTSKFYEPNLNGMTPLHFACCSQSSYEIVTELINQYHVDVNVVDKFRRTPLHYAAIYGLDSIVEELLTNGAQRDFCDLSLETPLHKAIVNVQNKVIEVLISHDASIDLSNKDGFSPLHLACMANIPRLCNLLIESGANPMTSRDACGRTPHYMAVYMGSFECFCILMSSPYYIQLIENDSLFESNDQVYIPLFSELDVFQRSLLHYAAASKCTEGFIQFLLSKESFQQTLNIDSRVFQALSIAFSRFNINQQDLYGRTPLHYLCRRSMEIDMDLTSLVRLMIENGANPFILDSSNRFPIHYAVRNGYTSTLSSLVDIRWFQDRNAFNQFYQSASCPLKLAAFHGHTSTLSELLRYGFNDYESAIEIAIRRSKWNCVVLLIPYIRSKSLFRKLAMITAYRGLIDGLKLFIDWPFINFQQLLFASALSSEGSMCVEMLTQKRVDVQVRDRHGRNALFYATVGGCKKTIIYLLQSGIKFVKDTRGQNVFHLVASKGDVRLLKIFAENLKNCNSLSLMFNLMLSKNNENLNPIEIACIKKHQAILQYYILEINPECEEKLMFFAGLSANLSFVKFLLKKNGFLYVKGHYERGLLHYCCMSELNNLEMLKYLIGLNFDLNEKDETGLTPLLCAACVGNFKTVEYLLENTNVDPKVIDNVGNTILHHAVMSGSKKTSLYLIDYFIKHQLIEKFVSAKNFQNQSCLHLAAKSSLPSVVQELLRYGASIYDEDQRGYTPSMYCARDLLAAYCQLMIESYHETSLLNSTTDSQNQLEQAQQITNSKEIDVSSEKENENKNANAEKRIQRMSLNLLTFQSKSDLNEMNDAQTKVNNEISNNDESSGVMVNGDTDSDSDLY